MAGLAVIHQPQHQRVQPQAREGHEARPRFRCAREEEPAATVARPRRGTPAPGRLRFARQQLQRVRHHVERGQHAAPLRRRLPVDHRGVRRPVHTSIDLVVVTEPRGEFFGGRPERQQVGEDASWTFREERILVGAIGKERRRQRERFGLVAPLIAGTPVRTARVERIENRVAALGPVELWRVFERRVVHDRRVAAGLELQQHLSDQRRLPGARVAHDEEVARLDGARNSRAPTGCPAAWPAGVASERTRCRRRASGG